MKTAIYRQRSMFVVLLACILMPLMPISAPQAETVRSPPIPDRASLPRLKQLFADNAELCTHGAAIECTEQTLLHFDQNADSMITRDEIAHLEKLLSDYADWQRDALQPAEKQYLRIGALVLKLVGPRGIISLIDEDGDDAITSRELMSGIRDVERPWPEIASTPGFITQLSAFSRLGLLKHYINRALPTP